MAVTLHHQVEPEFVVCCYGLSVTDILRLSDRVTIVTLKVDIENSFVNILYYEAVLVLRNGQF